MAAPRIPGPEWGAVDPSQDPERRRSHREIHIPHERGGGDVNHPLHYVNRKMEAIDIIEMIIEIEPNSKVSYNMSNVLKYLLRFRDKGNPVKDLEKATWYLNRMIKHVEGEA